ncbi:hypothetical protein BDV25DRAFT_145533 [Aspergillus avenaceus]|uniref:Apple domain-containing protein n=1 Tax=Aspergillus avenaceus TaxID=36643 RepID=A0A5N6TDR5_ASPAV|nr:hypothetical protein BDV25DRAFT_145533 [Aspergillus avenaceus]
MRPTVHWISLACLLCFSHQTVADYNSDYQRLCTDNGPVSVGSNVYSVTCDRTLGPGLPVQRLGHRLNPTPEECAQVCEQNRGTCFGMIWANNACYESSDANGVLLNAPGVVVLTPPPLPGGKTPEQLAEELRNCETEKGGFESRASQCDTEKGQIEARRAECVGEKNTCEQNKNTCEQQKTEAERQRDGYQREKNTCVEQKVEVERQRDEHKERLDGGAQSIEIPTNAAAYCAEAYGKGYRQVTIDGTRYMIACGPQWVGNIQKAWLKADNLRDCLRLCNQRLCHAFGFWFTGRAQGQCNLVLEGMQPGPTTQQSIFAVRMI